MNFPMYPEYRDSGHTYIGNVPAHWDIKPLKHCLRLNTEKAIGKSSPIGLENIEGWSARYVPTESEFEGVGTEFLQGDILFGKLRPYLAKVYQAEFSGEAIGDFHVMRPVPSFAGRYALYQILQESFISILDGATHGAKMPRVGWEFMGNMPFAAPKPEEQIQIARFLDHETAKIDALIREQERLIELLQEKRQAGISHAVTKGVNPDVPMKESGVEWLGEVPAHWKVMPAKFLLSFVTSGSRGWAEFYSEAGELFFRITNLSRDSIRPKLESIQYVTPPEGSEGSRAKINVGDILISITADLGSVCAADEFIKGGYVSQHVALARPIRTVCHSDWLAYFILGNVAKEQLLGSGYGGTKVQLSLEDIRELVVAVPPINEQESIASLLDQSLGGMEMLIDEAKKAVVLLSERRSALISAAVTGKIDVRNWHPPSNESAFDEELRQIGKEETA